MVYCPECGAKIRPGDAMCPQGHRVGTTAAAVVVSAASAARHLGAVVRPGLSLGAPSQDEARLVVVGLKILAIVTSLAGLVMWRIAAQLLAGLGAPKTLAVAFPLGAFSVAFALYGEALLVQCTVLSLRRHADTEKT